MEKYLRVQLLLDQDMAGKTCTQKALHWNRDKYTDRSEFYAGYKDLNDWLIHHHQSLKQSHRRGKRL